MYQANEFDYLEEARTAVDGLNCLRQMLEMADQSVENLSYQQLAGMVGALALSLKCNIDHTFTILHSKR